MPGACDALAPFTTAFQNNKYSNFRDILTPVWPLSVIRIFCSLSLSPSLSLSLSLGLDWASFGSLESQSDVAVVKKNETRVATMLRHFQRQAASFSFIPSHLISFCSVSFSFFFSFVFLFLSSFFYFVLFSLFVPSADEQKSNGRVHGHPNR